MLGAFIRHSDFVIRHSIPHVPVDNVPLHPIIRRMRILLLEDQSKLLSFAKKGLEEQGIQVDAVSDGDEAWE
ncbi:MAG: hypothetical protein Q8M07_12615, partial [Prosthecobacter sp.]|nr:hypothetical protein [Prosthecobacter sp.]